MKNKTFSRLIAGAALLITFSFSSSLKAQCGPYLIKNFSNCQAIINYAFTCVGGPPCVPTGSTGITLLEGGGQIVIPACTCPSGKCVFSVTITNSGISPVSPPVTVNNSNTFATYPSPCPGPHNMTWAPGMVSIN